MGAKEREFKKRMQQSSSRVMKQLHFIGGVIRSPQRLGAIAPTSAVVSDVIASHISSNSGLPVLELGPGTGPVTDAILRRGIAEKDIVAIEYDESFCNDWQARYPAATIIQGNALNLDQTLQHLGDQQFDCIVSGIPMLNFSQKDQAMFLETAFKRIAPGRPIIQITYGRRSPISVADSNIEMTASRRILRNLPPAKIWTYRKY
ncbi:class I SAM-dependent methyltransferase [Ahrensia marina]|nr:methyltransferase domain-containing protein [Ahrensia marina]